MDRAFGGLLAKPSSAAAAAACSGLSAAAEKCQRDFLPIIARKSRPESRLSAVSMQLLLVMMIIMSRMMLMMMRRRRMRMVMMMIELKNTFCRSSLRADCRGSLITALSYHDEEEEDDDDGVMMMMMMILG